MSGYVKGHSITVRQLKELLTSLQDDDVLVPNAVANFAIERGNTYVGFINLLEGHQKIEMNKEVPLP